MSGSRGTRGRGRGRGGAQTRGGARGGSARGTTIPNARGGVSARGTASRGRGSAPRGRGTSVPSQRGRGASARGSARGGARGGRGGSVARGGARGGRGRGGSAAGGATRPAATRGRASQARGGGRGQAPRPAPARTDNRNTNSNNPRPSAPARPESRMDSKPSPSSQSHGGEDHESVLPPYWNWALIAALGLAGFAFIFSCVAEATKRNEIKTKRDESSPSAAMGYMATIFFMMAVPLAAYASRGCPCVTFQHQDKYLTRIGAQIGAWVLYGIMTIVGFVGANAEKKSGQQGTTVQGGHFILGVGFLGAGAVGLMVLSYWYTRNLTLRQAPPTREFRRESSGMLKFNGVATSPDRDVERGGRDGYNTGRYDEKPRLERMSRYSDDGSDDRRGDRGRRDDYSDDDRRGGGRSGGGRYSDDDYDRRADVYGGDDRYSDDWSDDYDRRV